MKKILVIIFLFLFICSCTAKTIHTKPDPSSYKTINYKECSRYPEKYKGNKVILKGEAIQVLGNRDKGFTIRLATSNPLGISYYDDVYYLTVNYDPGYNILENDKLIVYAELAGSQTYQAVLGNTITIPAARVDWVELVNGEFDSTPVNNSINGTIDVKGTAEFYTFATAMSTHPESTEEPELLIAPKK